MLKLLKKLTAKKKSQQTKAQPQSPSPTGWHTPMTATELLDTPLRQQYLTTIWQNVSMSPKMFDLLYRTPINRYVEMVQLLPASESHHHSHLGGMIDHGLEVIAIGSKLRQSYVLPQNAAPEDQAKQRDVWTAVVIYAALIHDIGKVATDLEIVLLDGTRWFPWQGIPKQPYNFRYIKGRDYHLHPALGSFFVGLMIPKEAFDWIAPFPEAFSKLMYFAANHTDKAGILGEIIQKADQYSVTVALGGEPTKLAEKPKTSFAKQLHLALQEVIKSYKLNTPKGGGQGWLAENGLWVMAKTTADSIRAYLIGQGISAPSKNGAMFDELVAHNLIEVTGENTAIWNVNVNSDSGWTKQFSMLKIQPSVIWENIDQRPNLFDGTVTLTDKNDSPSSEEITAAAAETLSLNAVIQAIPAQPVKVAIIQEVEPVAPVIHTPEPELEEKDDLPQDSDDMDMVLSLFEETSEQNVMPEPEPKMEETAVVLDIPKPKPASKVKAELPVSKPIKQSKTAVSEPTETAEIGEVQPFIDWVRSNVLSGKLLMNQNNAKLHFVENHLFMVTPSIFQLYCADVIGNTDKPTWERLQKQFQNLGIHKRQHLDDGDSRNIWICKVAGPNRQSTLNGYLIENVEMFVGNKLVINNQWLTLIGKIQ